MTPDTLYKLTPPLISLQFLALCWTVNREIKIAGAERQSVIPLPDVINILSLFATVGCLVVLPLATESYLWLSRMILGAAYVLIAFHPFTVAAQYQLWRRKERRENVTDGAGSPYANRQQCMISLFSVLIATAVAGISERTFTFESSRYEPGSRLMFTHHWHCGVSTGANSKNSTQ